MTNRQFLISVFLMLPAFLILVACAPRDRWEGKVDYGAHGVLGY